MAGSYKATTVIRYGKEDGTPKEFQPGDDVSGLPQETTTALLEAGALVEKKEWERLNASTSSREASEVEEQLRGQLTDRDQEIARLKAELAKAGRDGTSQSPTTPPAQKK